ncbi:hypothetical protein DEV92_104310 [Phyllobacterium myrsinacearum]|jgi:hypothetical protein|nr:hypothetical protein DEV92_104310 [Phyllobacterium myrsinacearum]RZV04760.1 hypothetical protein EV654_3565 [Phyllobacterium myrsinacearum]
MALADMCGAVARSIGAIHKGEQCHITRMTGYYHSAL